MAGRRHAFLCQGGDRQISVFAQAFGSSGNRAKAPALLEAPIASELTIDRAGDDELHGLKWVARPQTVWSSNIINPEGTVWVSWAPNQGDYRYRFDTFLGDRIVSTRISLPEKGMQDVTGLAQSRSGWVVVAAVNIRSAGAKRYLVEIDQTGRLTRIAALTERQYAMISD